MAARKVARKRKSADVQNGTAETNGEDDEVKRRKINGEGDVAVSRSPSLAESPGRGLSTPKAKLPQLSRPKSTTGTNGGTQLPKDESASPRASPAKSSPHSRFTPNRPPTRRLEVFVCGSNEDGELGLALDGGEQKIDQPKTNSNFNPREVGVVDLACGEMHALALTHDGTVLSWGCNDTFNLGRETGQDKRLGNDDELGSDDSIETEPDVNPLEATPTEIDGMKLFGKGKGVVQVAAGASASFVLTEAGTVYGWGTFRDSIGEKVFRVDPKHKTKKITVQAVPVQIPNLSKITALSAGADFCLALNAAGHVYAWGRGEQCELGRRVVQRRLLQSLTPALVELPRRRKMVSIHAAANHAFAVDDAGDTWAWGANNFAQTGIPQLGDGEEGGGGGTVVNPPQRVPLLAGLGMKMLAGGTHHSVGVTHGGECYVWGRVDGFQTGVALDGLDMDDPDIVAVDERGKPRILLKPTKLPIKNCEYVAAGGDHTILVTKSGKVYTWGFNVNFQCGRRDEDVPVAAMLDADALKGKKVTWCGAGGQYSMMAAPAPGFK